MGMPPVSLPLLSKSEQSLPTSGAFEPQFVGRAFEVLGGDAADGILDFQAEPDAKETELREEGGVQIYEFEGPPLRGLPS